MTDIAPWEQPETPAAFTPPVDLHAWVQDFRDVYAIAEALCKTPFVPREMMGHRDTVAACIMKGKELGLSPFEALGSIYIVHGRPGLYADFMRRRILQAGHIFKIIESTDSRCVVEGVRRDSGQTHRASFTAEQARKAGIDLGRYPSDKLVARATSRLCKQAFPDVLSGSLIAEDLIDGLIPTDDTITETTGGVGLLLSEAPPVQRKRATRAPKAVRTQPKPAEKPADDELAELLNDTPEPAGSGAPEEQEQLPLPPGPAPDQPRTDAQFRKLMALLHQLDINEVDDQYIVIAYILGYQIETRKNITKNEANKLIDTIDSWIFDTAYPVENRILEILNEDALRQAAEPEQDTDDGL